MNLDSMRQSSYSKGIVNKISSKCFTAEANISKLITEAYESANGKTEPSEPTRHQHLTKYLEQKSGHGPTWKQVRSQGTLYSFQ